MSSDSSAVPVLITDHAKRRPNSVLPQPIIQALGLTPEQAGKMYISDSAEFKSNNLINDVLYQIHYKAEVPDNETKHYRGLVILKTPYTNVLSVCARSYEWEDPIVSDTLPAHGKGDKYSISKQGFLARVFMQHRKIFVSTHRKIDCANSKFGNSTPLKQMFLDACSARGLDLEKVFKGRENYCHIFFVSNKELCLIDSEDCDNSISYLGSFVRKTASWADEDDLPDDKFVLMPMLPVSPNIPELEAIRVTYYDEEQATKLFESGTPLVKWSPGRDPTRLIPTVWHRREQIRGNTPNLKLAWYKLLTEGRQDELLEVVGPANRDEVEGYMTELWQLLGITDIVYEADDKIVIKGKHAADKDTMVRYFIDLALDVMKIVDANRRVEFLEELPNAIKEEVKGLVSLVNRKYNGLSPKAKIEHLTRYLRYRFWTTLTGENLYTLITSYKKHLKKASMSQA